MIENQRNKKQSEAQEEVEKIKNKKNKQDEDLRKHTEKDDGRKKMRILIEHAGKRSRSKEDRIEKEEKIKRKLKAETVSQESISDTDLQVGCCAMPSLMVSIRRGSADRP